MFQMFQDFCLNSNILYFINFIIIIFKQMFHLRKKSWNIWNIWNHFVFYIPTNKMFDLRQNYWRILIDLII